MTPPSLPASPLERSQRAVIAFVGMAFEARIAAGPGIHVFSRDARHELEAAAASASRHGYRGIISFGVAGGLADELRPGDWVVASAVAEAQGSNPTDAAWSQKLLNAIAGAHHAPVIGVDTPIADPAKKRELRRLTGAAAVDMESHIVARVAAAHGLAFTALRVIVDPAHRAIPRAALKGMGAGSAAPTAPRSCATSSHGRHSWHCCCAFHWMPLSHAAPCSACGCVLGRISPSPILASPGWRRQN